jgi:YbgC/YbaW family acyl-CoA thioester hydrolase
MYHAAYIDFFARARNEWARTIGFGISEQNQRGICLVVHEISATYHKPAKLDDLVEIETTLITASRIKILFHQKLYRTDPQSHLKSLLAEAQVSVVCVDQESLQVKRLSQEDLALLHST